MTLQQVAVASLLASFVATMLLMAVLSFHLHRIYTILRARHAETWRSLGSPVLLRNSPRPVVIRFRQFLGEGGHEALGDPELVRVVRRMERLERGWYVVFALLLASVVLIWITAA